MSIPALFTKHQRLAEIIASDWRIPGMGPDDVRQEARVALWIACRTYDPTVGKFPPFAGTVIRRRMASLLKAATAEKRTAEFEIWDEPIALDVQPGREQLQLMLDVLPSLTDREREAVRDHLNGMPTKETKSHDSSLGRARAKMREAAA